MSHRTDRRHRKKRRERNESPLSSHGVSAGVGNGSQRDVELFRDPTEFATDLRLVRRAVNSDWDVPSDRRDWIVEKVMEIVQQEGGPSQVEADQNSILACSVMLDMYISTFRERERILASKMKQE